MYSLASLVIGPVSFTDPFEIHIDFLKITRNYFGASRIQNTCVVTRLFPILPCKTYKLVIRIVATIWPPAWSAHYYYEEVDGTYNQASLK